MDNKEKIYVGYELGKDYCQISLISPASGKEPVLIPAITGGENTRIPLLLAKKKGVEQWYFGQEAEQKIAEEEAVAAEDFYEKAQNSEQIILEEKEYEAELLMQMYLKKTFSLLLGYVSFQKIDLITFCVDKITPKQVQLWKTLQKKFPFPEKKSSLISHSEGFACYVMTQEETLWDRGVILLDYDGSLLDIKSLEINKGTMPRIIKVDTLASAELPKEDETLFSLLKQVLEGKKAAMVYLVGTGFAESWYSNSLKLLCQGRRVFRGQNLYGMGALTYGKQREEQKNRKYLYLGQEQVKLNFAVPAICRGQEVDYELVSAEEHWYEAGGELDVLLGESRELVFYVSGLYGGRQEIKLPLSEFPLREERASRLGLQISFTSEETGIIKAEDLGFGEIYPATGKCWQQEIDLVQLAQQLAKAKQDT